MQKIFEFDEGVSDLLRLKGLEIMVARPVKKGSFQREALEGVFAHCEMVIIYMSQPKESKKSKKSQNFKCYMTSGAHYNDLWFAKDKQTLSTKSRTNRYNVIFCNMSLQILAF